MGEIRVRLHQDVILPPSRCTPKLIPYSSQIDWFLNASASIKPISRPFQPDGAADLGRIWSRQSQTSRLPRQVSKLAKPNAMMWFHIPLAEAYNAADTAGFDGEELDVGTEEGGAGNSNHNSGFFYNALKEAFEVEDGGEMEWFGEAKTTEVKVLSHGHCHNTDRCRRVDGIWWATLAFRICSVADDRSGYALMAGHRILVMAKSVSTDE